jgi:hypothetical protein
MQKTGYTNVAGKEPHAHAWQVDEYGNGETHGTIGQGPPHTHRITNKKVDPAGFDNHTHTLGQGKPTIEE